MTGFSYKNQTERMVVLKCVGPDHFYFERVLFPSELFVFEAPEGARIEVWGNQLYGPRLEERIRVTAPLEDESIAA